MKKIFTLALTALFALSMGTMVACDKDDESSSSTTSSSTGGNGSNSNRLPSEIANTHWEYTVGEYGEYGYFTVYVDFSTHNAGVTRQSIQPGNVTTDNFYGSATYSNGSGTIQLLDGMTDENRGTATYIISGTTMTLNLLGETYTLTKYVATR
ncbi:MAG: hypothetical protein IJU19_04935 [Bacteroidales bacterium]|nr:hypothetical protein [Bacteroidales bacterium]